MNRARIPEELPTLAEQQALDEALLEFKRDPSPGEPWREVFRQIRETHE